MAVEAVLVSAVVVGRGVGRVVAPSASSSPRRSPPPEAPSSSDAHLPILTAMHTSTNGKERGGCVRTRMTADIINQCAKLCDDLSFSRGQTLSQHSSSSW